MESISYWQLYRRAIRLSWMPSLVMSLCVAAKLGGVAVAVLYLRHQVEESLLRLFSAFTTPTTIVLGMLWVTRRILYAMQDDEQLANFRALKMIERVDFFWPLRQPDEHPRETLMLGFGFRWLVLANQRLLLFRANNLNARLQVNVPRRAIREAQFLPLEEMPWHQRLNGWMLASQGYLRFVLADGKVITGMVRSGCKPVALRMVSLINAMLAASKADSESVSLFKQLQAAPRKGDVLRETPTDQ
jgi:hypothetical protein